MKVSLTQSIDNPKSKGFSLVEVIIALGIVALLLTGFLGVFGTAQKNIQRSISVKEANMLRDSLEVELNTLRPKENYKSSFDKAFEMIKNSTTEKTAILIYQYKAQSNKSYPKDNKYEGIQLPYDKSDAIPGKNYLTQSAVRVKGVNDDLIKNELNPLSAVGSVYVVKLTQLVKNKKTGSLETIENNAGKLTTLDKNGDYTPVSSYHQFNEAVIIFQAEFYRLPTNAPGFVTGDKWTFTKSAGKVGLGAPVATINLAVRR